MRRLVLFALCVLPLLLVALGLQPAEAIVPVAPAPAFSFNAHQSATLGAIQQAGTTNAYADSTLASNGNQIVTAVNSEIRLFEPDGDLLANSTIQQMFGLAAGAQVFGAKLIYHPVHGRYVLIASRIDRAANPRVSQLLLAVSRNPTITGFTNTDWAGVTINFGNGTAYAQVAGLGYDAVRLYVTLDVFTFDPAPGAFATNVMANLLWSELNVGAPATLVQVPDINLPVEHSAVATRAYHLQPVQGNGGAYLVSAGNQFAGTNRTGLALYKIDPATGLIASTHFVDTDDWLAPPNAREAGGDQIQVFDHLEKAVVLNNLLYTSQTVRHSGANLPAVRFYRLGSLAANPPVAELVRAVEGDIAANQGFYFPSVAPDPRGNTTLVFQASGVNDSHSIFHTRITRGGLVEIPRVALISNFTFQVFQQPNFFQPWGRYTDAILDPSDDEFILSHAQLALDSATWRTVVQRVPNRYVQVLAPNGGDVFNPGQVTNIEWAAGSADVFTNSIRIQLSLDGGGTWNTIPGMNGIDDDGIEAWTVPATLSIHARIRVIIIATGAFDDSDADFTIADPSTTSQTETPAQPIPIPDNWQSEADWIESELFLPGDLQIQGLSVAFKITHPYPPDLEVYLVHPDGTSVVLHDQSGVPQLGPVVPWTGTERRYPVPISPDEGTQQFLNKLLLKRSKLWTPEGQELPWKLRVRDLAPTSIGTLNEWSLTVTGPPSIRLKVTKPNGGERYRIGQPNTVTWTNDPNNPVQGNVDIILDRNGDFSANPPGDQEVLGNVPVDTGVFNIPSVPGPEVFGTAKVRVRSTATQFDDSDAGFSILNDFVNLLTPAGGGGTEFFANQTVPITWDKLPTNQDVKIELTRNASAMTPTWETLSASESGTQFDWVVTGPDTSDARIRITSLANGSLTDQSGIFKITTKFIEVTGPTGIVDVDTTPNVTWNTDGLPGSVRIELTRNADAMTPTWEDITASTLNDGSHPWLVTGPPTAHAKIRITSLDEPSFTDEGPEFTIRQATITVTSPIAGDQLAVSKKWEIRWTVTAPLGPLPDATFVKIEVQRGLGAWQTITGSTQNDGLYVWGQDPPDNDGIDGPPNPVDQDSRIRITSLTYPSTFDVSDDFKIVTPGVRVTTPNGGEGLGIGQVFNIKWVATPPTGVLNPSFVSISISRDNGMSWTPIPELQNTPNDGEANWTVTGPPTTQALIRISVDGGVFPAETDESNAVFRIDTQQIDVTEPHLDEQLFVGTTKLIQWAAVGVPGNVRIIVQRPGEADEILASDVPSNLGSFLWNPITRPAQGATVRVESVDDTNVFGVSDAFDIVVFGLQITSPTGTPQWGVGTNRKITWTFGSGYTGVAEVYVRHAGSMTDTLIGSAAAPGGNGELDWGVTGPPGTATITVRVPGTDPVQEDSETVEIVNPSITVTAPAAGTELRVGQQTTFTWNSVGLQQNDLTNGHVNISLSRNGGPFAPLAGLQNIVNTGSANWVPTGPDSNNVRIRVTSVELPAVSDDSDVFKIVTPSIVVTKPAAGDSFIIGDQTTIEWTSLGVTGPVAIDISRNGGPWENLFPSVPVANGSQAWTVTGDANGNGSPNNRIRVRSIGGGENAEGIMVGTFTIIKPSITVGTPNGGQQLLTGSQLNITWGSTGIPANENVSIELLNNGAVAQTISGGTPNDGSFLWTVPNMPGVNFRIRITRTGSPAATDTSDSNFSIVGGTIHVDSPNGGEKLKKKRSATILWSGTTVNAKGGGGTVDIYLSTDGGVSYTKIISNTANDGSVNFVPTKSTKKGRIKIEWKPNPSVNDASDANFRIK